MSKELDELKEQLNILQQKVYELESKKNNKKEWWIPNIDEKYWYINGDGTIYNTCNKFDNFDKKVIKNNMYYKTKELAERKAFEQLLHRKLEKFAYENNDKEIDWKNHNQYKYSIYYDYFNNVINIHLNNGEKKFYQVYFTSREIADKAIETFKDDLIRYFTTDK